MSVQGERGRASLPRPTDRSAGAVSGAKTSRFRARQASHRSDRVEPHVNPGSSIGRVRVFAAVNLPQRLRAAQLPAAWHNRADLDELDMQDAGPGRAIFDSSLRCRDA